MFTFINIQIVLFLNLKHHYTKLKETKLMHAPGAWFCKVIHCTAVHTLHQQTYKIGVQWGTLFKKINSNSITLFKNPKLQYILFNYSTPVLIYVSISHL